MYFTHALHDAEFVVSSSNPFLMIALQQWRECRERFIVSVPAFCRGNWTCLVVAAPEGALGLVLGDTLQGVWVKPRSVPGGQFWVWCGVWRLVSVGSCGCRCQVLLFIHLQIPYNSSKQWLAHPRPPPLPSAHSLRLFQWHKDLIHLEL